MKPTILQQETAGRHNGDLAASTARVLKGGTWKRQRVVMVIPAADAIPARVYLSHISLIFPPNQAAHRMLALGMEVGDAYSQAVAQILAHPELSTWEYLLTVEHDNCPPCDGLVKLIGHMENNPHLSALSGLYWTKGEGGVPQIWGRPDLDPVVNYRPSPPVPGQIVDAYGLGMGFCLHRMSLFKDERIRRPWFRTLAGREGVGTQDLAFWAEARKAGHRCAVACDVLVGHYDHKGQFGPPDTMW